MTQLHVVSFARRLRQFALGPLAHLSYNPRASRPKERADGID
jgi:hypothetical protein